MQEAELRQKLLPLGIADLRAFDVIGSTNDEALDWAATGAADASLVIADSQIRGRGRLGRHWVTNPGAALAFSLILQPTPQEIAHLALFSPLAGLGVSLALEKIGLSPQIKWPNDVLLNRKKVCGILAEAAWLGNNLQGVVIGIGINIAPAAVPPADQLLFPATCVEEALGSPTDRLEILSATIEAILHWRSLLSSKQFVHAWQERLAFRGEWVRVENTGGTAITGQVIGITSDGNLQLRTPSGEEAQVTVGDVHLRPAEEPNQEGGGD